MTNDSDGLSDRERAELRARFQAAMGAKPAPTLAEFLLARIAEDHAVALEAYDHGEWDVEADGNGDTWVVQTDITGQPWRVAMVDPHPAAHIARFDPTRVIAECVAKRRIVERAEEAQRAADAWTSERLSTDTRSPLPEWSRRDAYAEVLRDLASAYVDHPDYREEWRA